jgi:hypothetical protein
MAVTVSRVARLGALLVLAAVVVALLPSTAPLPATANPSAYSLSRQTFPDGREVVARWNPCQSAVTYKVNLKYAAKTKAGRIKALKDVKQAAARLSSATGITFRYRGTTTVIPKDAGSKSWGARQTNAEIVISWVKQSTKAGRSNLLGRSGSGWAAGSGGYSYKFWRVGDEPWRGVTGRGFVVLDSAQNKKFKAGFGSGTTRGDLLLHELGHVVGLNHVTATSQVMYPTIRKHPVSGYAEGDRTGLAQLGRQAGCISVPAWVWKDLN